MKYEIDSSTVEFNGKDFKQLFFVIQEVCDSLGLTYFVVGAFAREILLKHIYKEDSHRATRDIDVALQMCLWKDFNVIKTTFVEAYNFEEGDKTHELISPEGIYIDLIPYGEIEGDRTISFPPDDHIIMNMLGFQEVAEYALTISIDGEIDVNIASIESIVLLKIIAWNDRKPAAVSAKHVSDLKALFEVYYTIKAREIVEAYGDLFDYEPFDEITCGVEALGRRISKICVDSDRLQQQIYEIMDTVLKDTFNSTLISQLMDKDQFDRNYATKVIEVLNRGIRYSH